MIEAHPSPTPATNSPAVSAQDEILREAEETAWVMEGLAGDVRRVFDLAFDVYRRYVWRFIWIAVLVLVPIATLLVVLENTWMRPLEVRLDAAGSEDDFMLVAHYLLSFVCVGVPTYGVPGFISVVGFSLMSIPLTYRVAELVFGQGVFKKGGLWASLRCLPRLVLAWIAGGLAFFGAYATVFLGCLGAVGVFLIGVNQAGQNSVEGDMILFLGLITVPYCIAMLAWVGGFTFSVPLVALENIRFLHIPHRNQQLMPRPVFRRIWLPLMILPLVITVMMILINTAVVMVLSSLVVNSQVHFWVQSVVVALLNLLFQPYVAIVLALLYFHCSFQREGLDIRLLAHRAGLEAPIEPLPSSPSLSAPVRRFMSVLLVITALSGIGVRSMAQSPPPKVDAEQVQSQLKEILGREEFRSVSPQSGNPFRRFSTWLKEQWERFWQWLQKLLQVSQVESAGSALQWVFIALFVVVGVWVLVRIFRALRGRTRRRVEAELSPLLVEELERFDSSQEWLEEAERLAVEGGYRSAQRALFLCALMRLHETGAVTFSRFRSNGEYVRALEQYRQEERQIFSSLTEDFDRLWYGEEATDRRGYEVARGKVRQLLEEGASV
jgi:hypothetical protein